MKRFISLALACLMIICFVGCDKEEVDYSFKSGEVGFSVNHDADAVIPQEIVGEIFDDGFSVEGLGNAVQLDDLPAQTAGCGTEL